MSTYTSSTKTIRVDQFVRPLYGTGGEHWARQGLVVSQQDIRSCFTQEVIEGENQEKIKEEEKEKRTERKGKEEKKRELKG